MLLVPLLLILIHHLGSTFSLSLPIELQSDANESNVLPLENIIVPENFTDYPILTEFKSAAEIENITNLTHVIEPFLELNVSKVRFRPFSSPHWDFYSHALNITFLGKDMLNMCSNLPNCFVYEVDVPVTTIKNIYYKIFDKRDKKRLFHSREPIRINSFKNVSITTVFDWVRGQANPLLYDDKLYRSLRGVNEIRKKNCYKKFMGYLCLLGISFHDDLFTSVRTIEKNLFNKQQRQKIKNYSEYLKNSSNPSKNNNNNQQKSDIDFNSTKSNYTDTEDVSVSNNKNKDIKDINNNSKTDENIITDKNKNINNNSKTDENITSHKNKNIQNKNIKSNIKNDKNITTDKNKRIKNDKNITTHKNKNNINKNNTNENITSNRSIDNNSGDEVNVKTNSKKIKDSKKLIRTLRELPANLKREFKKPVFHTLRELNPKYGSNIPILADLKPKKNTSVDEKNDNTTNFNDSNNITTSIENTNEPVVEDGQKNRKLAKLTLSSDYDNVDNTICEFHNNGCCLKNISLPIKDLGWESWVKYPETLNTSICIGYCNGTHINSMNSLSDYIMAFMKNIVYKKELYYFQGETEEKKCCIPVNKEDYYFHYIDHKDIEMVHVIPNFKVTRCHCL